MKIGDKVKLKAEQSAGAHLQQYRNKTGTIIDVQGPNKDGRGKKYYRVGFDAGNYIDIGSWRVEYA